MRRSLGTAVFSGMLGVTLFGIFLTPVFFYLLQGLSEVGLFASPTFRRVGSPVAGGLVGLAVGFLLARLTHQRLAWEVAIAAAAAILGALVAVALFTFRGAAQNVNGQRCGFAFLRLRLNGPAKRKRKRQHSPAAEDTTDDLPLLH